MTTIDHNVSCVAEFEPDSGIVIHDDLLYQAARQLAYQMQQTMKHLGSDMSKDLPLDMIYIPPRNDVVRSKGYLIVSYKPECAQAEHVKKVGEIAKQFESAWRDMSMWTGREFIDDASDQ